MKFTKKEAFEKLKAELTKGGKTSRLTDRTINEMLDTLIPLMTNDETELDVFTATAFPVLNTANGNLEKDYSDFAKSFKPTPPKTDTKTEQENENDPIKIMQQQLAEMKSKMEESEREKNLGKVKGKLLNKMKEKGIDEEWGKEFLQEVTLTEDIDIDGKTESFLKIYNKSQAAVGTGATPMTPGGGSSDKKNLWDDLKPKENE